jgi:hypothetical protein
VAVQVHPHQRPVQPGGDLLDVGRLAGAVIALDHHAAVVGEPRADGLGRLRIELVGRVDLGDVAVLVAEERNLHVAVDAECVAERDPLVGGQGDQGIGGVAVGQVGHDVSGLPL